MMSPKISYPRKLITDCSETNPVFLELYNIFRATLKPDMPFREFKAYYCSARLDYIDVSFIVSDGVVVGFCAAAFYATTINKKPYTIGRAATGILEKYRGHTLPKWELYRKYIRYWRRHPTCRTLLSAYVANPLIYAMICKYTGIAYPRQGIQPPEYILRIKEDLLRSQNLHRKEGPDFVVEIHFCVAISDREQQRIFTSADRNVKYFLRINPKFRQQHGVIVVIPIHLKNILFSCCRFLYHGGRKIFRKFM